MLQRDPSKISFYGVGLVLILIGAAVLAIGGVEWCFNYFGDSSFVAPLYKFIAGAAVIGIGYIQLELELMRKAK